MMKYYTLFGGVLFICLGCQTTPTSEQILPERELASVKSKPKELTLSELKNILQQNNFSRINDLLQFLAQSESRESFKNYLSFHTFGFNSKSLHGSSYQNPRAIVYGRTGKFIITFNNDPTHNAYEMLEVAEFNDSTKKFEFTEIKFLNDERHARNLPAENFKAKRNGKFIRLGFRISPKGGPKAEGHYLADDLKTDPLDAKDLQARIGGKKVLFPEGKCMQCHANGRPIWESYNSWPGFYGGDDDVFFFILGGEPKKDINTISFEMRANFANFSRSKKGTRYEHLGTVAKDLRYAGSRPNGFLNELLVELNHQRVKKMVADLGPPILSPEKCDELASRDFIKEGNVLMKKLLDHKLAVRFETTLETSGREAAEREKFDYLSNYFKRDLQDIQDGREAKSTMTHLAAVEHFFPQLQAQTAPTMLFEGIYEFHSGSEGSPHTMAVLTNVIWEAKKLCEGKSVQPTYLGDELKTRN